jgi:hypothetical protein
MPVSRTSDGATPRYPRIDGLRAQLYGLPLRMLVRRPLARNRPIYFCSFPKTGRTWLRFLLCRYIDDLFKLGIDPDLASMFAIIPNLSLHQRRGVMVFRLRGDDRVPMVLASHAPFDNARFAVGTDLLLMIRGVHDVVVSSYFHSTRQRREAERFNGSLADFIEDPYKGVARLARYYNGWAEQLPNSRVCVTTYERLQSQPDDEVAAVLEFLGLPVDLDALARARVQASFDSMQSLERTGGIEGQEYDRSDPESLRMRKGQVGGYRVYLDDAEIARINSLCRDQLSPRALHLFADNGLDIG